MHQRRPDAAALRVGVHAERPQSQHRRPERLQPPAGRDHVPDQPAVVLGDQRQVRQEAGVLAELVDQPGLDDVGAPARRTAAAVQLPGRRRGRPAAPGGRSPSSRTTAVSVSRSCRPRPSASTSSAGTSRHSSAVRTTARHSASRSPRPRVRQPQAEQPHARRLPEGDQRDDGDDGEGDQAQLPGRSGAVNSPATSADAERVDAGRRRPGCRRSPATPGPSAGSPREAPRTRS